MRTASAGYWSKVFNPGRKVSMSVTITSTDVNQNPVTLTNSDIKSFSLDEQLMNDEQFEISNCIMKSFNFSFYDPTGSIWAIGLGGAKVELSINIDADTPGNAVDYVPYYINKVDRNGMLVSCESVDCIGFLEKEYVCTLPEEIQTPADLPTIFNLITDAVTQCGLGGWTEDGYGPVNYLTNSAQKGMTCRQLVAYAAQIMGKYAVADTYSSGYGQVRFIDITSSGKTVGKESIFSEKIAETPVHVNGLLYEGNGPQSSDPGQLVILPDNPLLDSCITPNATDESLNWALARFENLPDFYPAQLTMQSCPAFSVGDIVTMTKKDGTTYKVVITRISQTNLSKMTVRSSGKTAYETEYVIKGPVSSQINQINQEIYEIVNPTKITKNSDFNDYTSPGTFYVGSNATAATIYHIPTAKAGYLTVLTGGVLTQKYLTITGTLYSRYYDSWSNPNTWIAWHIIGGDDEIVDEGISGDWHYRKWYSGYAEAEGVIGFTPSWQTAGSFYYCYRTENLPFTFLKCYTAQCTVQRGSYLSMASGNSNVSPSSPGSNQTSVQALVFQWNNGSTNAIKVLYKVTGTWK